MPPRPRAARDETVRLDAELLGVGLGRDAPTVLLLDRAAVVRHRIVGAARVPDVLEALEGVAARTAA
jgi:hypothetical protein